METSTQPLPPPTAQRPFPLSPRRKYFHQLHPAPLELPEVICRIRSHLSIADIKKCMLVSIIWAKHFGPFLWEVVYFNRFSQQEDPSLRRNGHLIRKLITYSLRDKELKLIAKDCPNLVELDLEIDTLNSGTSLSDLFSSVNRIQKLKLQLLNPNELGKIHRALLDPIAKGVLSQLTEIKLMGFETRRYAPIYLTGMIIRCLEGCPLLQTLEISAIRLVDTIEQWDDAEKTSFSSLNSDGIILESSSSSSSSSSSPPPLSSSPPPLSSSSWFPWWRKPAKPRFASNPPPPPRRMPDTSTASADGAASPVPAAMGPDLAFSSPQQPKSDEYDPYREVSAPREDYKSKYLVTLKLGDLYGTDASLIAFVTGLLNRSPNLTYLSLRAVPADIENLATLCPKLRTLNMESHQYGSTFPQPAINKYLTNLSNAIANSSNHSIPPSMRNDMFLLRGIKSLRLSRCLISNLDLHAFPEDFKKYQLQRFELTHCPNVTSLGVATFLAQCWSLERVWVDNLATHVGVQSMLVPRTRIRGEGIDRRTSAGLLDPRAIKWECSQIRYLDVYGTAGSQESFEHIILDMIVRLDRLEFLGMSIEHVPWLMKLEPVTYIKLPRPSKDSEHRTGTNGHAATNTHAGNSRYNEPEDLREPTSLGLFGAVKTLSLEASNRSLSYYNRYNRAQTILSMEQVRYLHDAFPALEKIVYSCNTFPCSVSAREWLLKTPRQIEVVYRSKDEVNKAVWDV
ncbi:hypothetical protein BGX26_000485 [Mortierella sp. AD094]|nr:hypothetical protein BGX26_000485 [Mortierella sp. AD094]